MFHGGEVMVMAEFLSIGAAALILGVAVSTLRRWENESRFFSDFRTPGGHRKAGFSTEEAPVSKAG